MAEDEKKNTAPEGNGEDIKEEAKSADTAGKVEKDSAEKAPESEKAEEKAATPEDGSAEKAEQKAEEPKTEGPKGEGPKDEGSKDENDGKNAGESAGSEKADEKASKGFFGKKKDPRDEKIAELKDRVLRQMAEFDNYRKRTEKEKASMYEIGAKDVIEKILPIVDNFERGLAAAENKDDPFVQGMEKTYKQLMTTLDGLDVKAIRAEGETFDPNYHNAVMHCEDDSVGENTVVQELQKGYTYRGKVVRHSMVKVAN